MKIPVCLLRCEYPLSDDLKRGNPRFDAIYDTAQFGGIKEPLTINLNWLVMDGHHRLAVAHSLDIKAVDVRVWTGVEMVY